MSEQETDFGHYDVHHNRLQAETVYILESSTASAAMKELAVELHRSNFYNLLPVVETTLVKLLVTEGVNSELGRKSWETLKKFGSVEALTLCALYAIDPKVTQEGIEILKSKPAKSNAALIVLVHKLDIEVPGFYGTDIERNTLKQNLSSILINALEKLAASDTSPRVFTLALRVLGELKASPGTEIEEKITKLAKFGVEDSFPSAQRETPYLTRPTSELPLSAEQREAILALGRSTTCRSLDALASIIFFGSSAEGREIAFDELGKRNGEIFTTAVNVACILHPDLAIAEKAVLRLKLFPKNIIGLETVKTWLEAQLQQEDPRIQARAKEVLESF